jgi:arsenate reductase
MAATVQMFGRKKCQETRKAERWFKERGIPTASLDLERRGLSPGELRSVAERAGGMEALLDREGTRYRDRGLRAAAPTGARIEPLLLDDPLLLKTPIVRFGREATIGYRPEVWQTWPLKGS